MSLARPTTGDNLSSSSSSTPTNAPPAQATLESDVDDSDVESVSALRGGGDTVELRGMRISSEKHSDRRSLDEADSSSEDESGKEHIRPVKRVGSRSEEYTDDEERTIVRKLDRGLTLFIALLYMLSFLDRSSRTSPTMATVAANFTDCFILLDIGNARIAGLDESLSLSSSQYSWLLTSFYITYITFEWMTLLYQIVPPHIYISICVMSWGLIASLQSVCTSFISLAILRGFLGVAEAAFGPGVPFYLTIFYKRSELAYRVGVFIAAAPLATSFASSLAWVIVKVGQNGPIEPWRLLFLVEGFPSVVVAFFAFYILPDSPSTTRYLTVRERDVAKLRLQFESDTAHEGTVHGVKLSEVLATLLDPKAYFTALMFFSANVAFSSLPVFLPTILRDMSFSELASQALAAPPYLCAFVFLLLIAHFSDKIPDSRAWFIIGVSILSSASYGAIALAGALHEHIGESGTLTIRYIGVYGAASGFFSAVTLIITWTLNNQRSATSKGTGMTIIQVVGQCGPLLGVRLFPKSQAPYYVPGMSVCSAFMLLVAILALALRWYLARRNKSQTVIQYEMVGTDDDGLIRGGPQPASENTGFKFML